MLWEDNYLAHHGIQGQKWGVRRFQNKDGTLTAAGRERYYKKDTEVKKEFDESIKSKSEEVANIKSLAAKARAASDERDRAYKEYFSSTKISLSDKEKNGSIKKVIDSWFGKPITDDDQKEAYEFEVKNLLTDYILPDRMPSKLKTLDNKCYNSFSKYWDAVKKFENDLIKEFSGIQVFTTKKGLFGLEVMDKNIRGQDFIKQLIKDRELEVELGRNSVRNRDPNSNADLLLAKIADELYKEIDINWYNNQFK